MTNSATSPRHDWTEAHTLQNQKGSTNINELATGSIAVTNKANADANERGDTIVDEEMNEAKTWIPLQGKLEDTKQSLIWNNSLQELTTKN